MKEGKEETEAQGRLLCIIPTNPAKTQRTKLARQQCSFPKLKSPTPTGSTTLLFAICRDNQDTFFFWFFGCWFTVALATEGTWFQQQGELDRPFHKTSSTACCYTNPFLLGVSRTVGEESIDCPLKGLTDATLHLVQKPIHEMLPTVSLRIIVSRLRRSKAEPSPCIRTILRIDRNKWLDYYDESILGRPNKP